MFRKGILMMLCCAMTLTVLSGCGGNTPAATTTAAASVGTTVGGTAVPVETVPEMESVTEPTEEPWPDDGAYRAYYDDRIPVAELGGSENSAVEIVDQQVESYIVGSKDPDMAVLYFDQDNSQFIAVGTGLATVSIDGKEQLVRVRPAPISLFMITGHSIGAGQCGVKEQSVVTEAGQAYSSHKTSTFQEATVDMGIGYLAAVKPAGIDAFAPGGGGTIGEGSALAWKWNQLTGEKVWVLNAAVGGSVIPEWHKGQVYYEPAVAMFRAAEQVLANEVAAGHYKLKNMGIIYHSSANFTYKNVEYTDEIMEFWYDSMVNGFKQDLAFDITGDGQTETIQFVGFIPSGANNHAYDKPINYYMALSDAYEGCFMLAETIRKWKTDGRVNENFPQIEYTQTQSVPVEMPVMEADLYAEDKVHFTQVAYNAAGLVIGQNLYSYLRTKVELEEISIVTSNAIAVEDELNFKRVGSSYNLIAVCTPYYAADFTIELSENLELASPFSVKALAEGEGYIKITKDGKVVRNIVVHVGD